MDFKINKPSGSVLSSGDSKGLRVRAGSSESEKIESELSRERKLESKEDLVTFNSEQVQTGDSLVLSNIKKALGIADNALDGIERTLKERLYQARELASAPHLSSRNESYNSDSYSNQRLEGERIMSEASSNDQKVFAGGNYQLYSSDGSSQGQIATGPLVLPEPAGRGRVTNASDAANEEERLEQVISSFHSTRAEFKSALAKAESLSPTPKPENTTVETQRTDSLTSIAEAKDLAAQIANKLGSALKNEQSAAELIEASAGNLKLERVKALLS